MKEKHPLFVLPMASTALVDEPVLSFDRGDIVIPMVFDDLETRCTATLRFRSVRAYCKRAELHCSQWYIDGVYDTVCEIVPSDWVQDLLAATVPDRRDMWVLRHFMIYIDSYGCLEVVAKSAELEDVQMRNSGGT